jgi:hypothetical protein
MVRIALSSCSLIVVGKALRAFADGVNQAPYNETSIHGSG